MWTRLGNVAANDGKTLAQLARKSDRDLLRYSGLGIGSVKLLRTLYPFLPIERLRKHERAAAIQTLRQIKEAASAALEALETGEDEA